MLKFVLILFLFIGAPLGLKAQQDSYKYINVGNIPEYKVELRIYVGDNLKGMLKTINVDWPFPPNKTYLAITHTIYRKETAICDIFFTKDIALSTLVHEVSHCADVLPDNEDRANLTGFLTNYIIRVLAFNDIPVYYLTETSKKYLD